MPANPKKTKGEEERGRRRRRFPATGGFSPSFNFLVDALKKEE